MAGTGVSVADATAGDRAAWDVLYAGYAAFYDTPQDGAMRDRVWGWIHDPDVAMACLLARTPAGVVGLAHTRPFRRPLTASTGEYLDDLFVAPQARGQGVGRALVDEVRRRAGAQGRSTVRWITRDTNRVARALYDDLATATAWVTYDAEPLAPR